MAFNIGTLIGSALGKTGGTIIESVSKVVDDFTISKEEKAAINQAITVEVNRNIEALKSMEVDETKAYLADTQSARERDKEANNSLNAGWLAKNITPILAFGVILLTFILIYCIMFKGVNGVEKDILVYVLGALTGYVGMVLSYYFGSSKSSGEKDRSIKSLIDKR
jgi:ABC-type bacteriocin/lantibiotic exporter with double-glycine peptidase domain